VRPECGAASRRSGFARPNAAPIPTSAALRETPAARDAESGRENQLADVSAIRESLERVGEFTKRWAGRDSVVQVASADESRKFAVDVIDFVARLTAGEHTHERRVREHESSLTTAISRAPSARPSRTAAMPPPPAAPGTASHSPAAIRPRLDESDPAREVRNPGPCRLRIGEARR
jgi:hypothetical protein